MDRPDRQLEVLDGHHATDRHDNEVRWAEAQLDAYRPAVCLRTDAPVTRDPAPDDVDVPGGGTQLLKVVTDTRAHGHESPPISDRSSEHGLVDGEAHGSSFRVAVHAVHRCDDVSRRPLH